TTSGFTPGPANRIAQPTGTSYSDSGLGAGTYYYKVQAEDAAGNLSAPSNEASATVSTAPPLGLVAAYSFDQGSGTSLPDLSGNGNNGTIANASWSTGGKYGSALSFNGTNAIVNVPDSASLDLTSGMTLEAWVNPSALGTSWRTVLMKETSGDMVYDLYGNRNTTVPTTEVRVGGSAQSDNGTSALPLNTWVHLASTYDGNVLRLYVNGTQVSQLLVVGSIATSTGALRIGGNTIWPEWFAGLIDEVRIYNRALSTTEIQADMNTRVGP
ncbi:MAG TPA: LamG domain-containing protein, partial [Umezawaea sp.]|nr:LamG domain-containing protein [Umezawaea sp.]